MSHYNNTAEAYAVYRMMPLPEPLWLPSIHQNSPTLSYVVWSNPYSGERRSLHDGRREYETFLTKKRWVVCHGGGWGPVWYRHFTLEEFTARSGSDQEFREFMQLCEKISAS